MHHAVLGVVSIHRPGTPSIKSMTRMPITSITSVSNTARRYPPYGHCLGIPLALAGGAPHVAGGVGDGVHLVLSRGPQHAGQQPAEEKAERGETGADDTDVELDA
jgi:hypothetical protein